MKSLQGQHEMVSLKGRLKYQHQLARHYTGIGEDIETMRVKRVCDCYQINGKYRFITLIMNIQEPNTSGM